MYKQTRAQQERNKNKHRGVIEETQLASSHRGSQSLGPSRRSAKILERQQHRKDGAPVVFVEHVAGSDAGDDARRRQLRVAGGGR